MKKEIYTKPEFQSAFGIIIGIIIGIYESNLFYALAIYTLIYIMFELIEIKHVLTNAILIVVLKKMKILKSMEISIVLNK